MNNYELRPIDKSVAKRMIVKHHYSHCWTMCDVALGIFEIGQESSFFDTTDDKLIGVIVYGSPVGRQVVFGMSPLLKQGEVLELTRLWIQDGTPKNTESYCISKSFEWLKQHRKQVKVVVSYADGSVGHKGTIYQAANFLFQIACEGDYRGDFFISLTEPPECKWLHPRTLFSTYGTTSVDGLKKRLPKPYWTKPVRNKYRYIYFLCNKVEKKKLVASLKHPITDYPKELSNAIDEITKVE